MFGHIEGDCSKVLEGTKQSAYAPKRMARPGGVAMHKKGETSGTISVAMAPAGTAVPLGAQSVNQDVVVTHSDVMIGGSKPGKGNAAPILLPEKSVLTGENSTVPEQSELRPVDVGLQRLPDAGLGQAGTRVLNKMKQNMGPELPDAGLGQAGTRVLNKMKQQMGPELRSDAADILLSEDEGYGSLPPLEESSVQIREPITVGGREKETVVVTQGRQVVVRENRKLTAKGLSFAAVSKGKAKGKSLQSSK